MKAFTRTNREWALVAVASDARGVIAVGSMALGVVAVGVNAVGLVAVGVNAIGSVAALGLANAMGFGALGLANAIGVLSFSPVNAFGAYGAGLVNGEHGMAMGLVIALVMFGISFAARGRWQRSALVPASRLADLRDPAHEDASASMGVSTSANPPRRAWVDLLIESVAVDERLVVLRERRTREVVRATLEPALVNGAQALLGKAGRIALARTLETEPNERRGYRGTAPAVERFAVEAITVVPVRSVLPESLDEALYVGGWSLRVLGGASAVVTLIAILMGAF